MYFLDYDSTANSSTKLREKPNMLKKESVPVFAAGARGASSANVVIASSRSKASISIHIIAFIVMLAIALFSFSGCGGSNAESSNTGSPSSTPSKSAPMKSVDDYSWDELSEISGEISNETTEEGALEVAKKYNLVNSDGKLDGTQIKIIELKDGTTATVQIAGFLHDDKTGGGKAGITFIFKDAIAEHDMNPYRSGARLDPIGTNAGGWMDSAMRAWLSSEEISMLPSDLTDKIIAVDKKTNNVGETDDVASVTTTSDRLWLFSSIEIYGTNENIVSNKVYCAEGTEYKLFRDCNVSSSKDREILEKSFDGSKSSWWLRSPATQNGIYFEMVSSNGWGNSADSFGTKGVVPGFCI